MSKKYVIRSDYEGNKQSPIVTTLKEGFIVSWLQKSNVQSFKGNNIYIQKYSAINKKEGSVITVGEKSSEDKMYPSLSELSNGKIVVTWSIDKKDGSGYGVYAQILTEQHGNFVQGVEFRVNTRTTYNQLSSAITPLEDGGFIITWQSKGQDYKDLGYGIYAQEYDSEGIAINGEFQVNTYKVANQEFPAISSFANGNFVIAWHSYGQDGSGRGVYAQVFKHDSIVKGTTVEKLGDEFRVSAYTQNNQEYPAIAALSEDSFAIVYQSNEQDQYNIYGHRYYNNGSSIGNDFRISDVCEGDNQYSKIVSLSNNSFVVAWKEIEEGGSKIKSQLYHNNGTRIGDNVIIAEDVAWKTTDISIAEIGNTSYGVLWSDFNSSSYNSIFMNVMGPLEDVEDITEVPVKEEVKNLTKTESLLIIENTEETSQQNQTNQSTEASTITAEQSNVTIVETEQSTPSSTWTSVPMTTKGATETQEQQASTTSTTTVPAQVSTTSEKSKTAQSSIQSDASIWSTEQLTTPTIIETQGIQTSEQVGRGLSTNDQTTEQNVGSTGTTVETLVTNSQMETTTNPSVETIIPTEENTATNTTYIDTTNVTNSSGETIVPSTNWINETEEATNQTKLLYEIVTITNNTISPINGTSASEIFVIDSSVKYIVIYGGGGDDSYVFLPSNNSVLVIADFENNETIALTNFTSVTSYSELNITRGSTHIHLPENQTIIIQNKYPEDISEKNFKFLNGTTSELSNAIYLNSSEAMDQKTEDAFSDTSEGSLWWLYGGLIGVGALALTAVGGLAIYKHIHNVNKVVPFDGIGDVGGDLDSPARVVPIGEGPSFVGEVYE